MKRTFIFCSLALVILSFHVEQKKIAKLSKELNEISGLVMASDSTFFAINDSGNAPLVYLLSLKGKILKTIKVSNAKNIDWEDLTIDYTEKKLYIGDFGNNLNTRKNLCLYCIHTDDLVSKDSVHASKLSFSYPDQDAFPPTKSKLRFDCEAMCFYENQILLFSKNSSKNNDGTCTVYALEKDGSNMHLFSTIQLEKPGYFRSAITAADCYNNSIYLSTYSSLYKFKIVDQKFVKQLKINYKILTQKEAMSVKNEREIFVADEKTPLKTGGNLLKIQLFNDKNN